MGAILLISLLLGLRHATDPDHLAAVTTLIASEEDRDKVRKAGLMGLFGARHGTRSCCRPAARPLQPVPARGRQQAAEFPIGASLFSGR